MYTIRRMFNARWGVIFLVLGLAVFAWLLYLLRTTVFSFILGLIIAYLLMPPILWVEQRLPRKGKWQQTKRISLIFIAYIVILALFGLLAFFVYTAIVHAFSVVIVNAPEYTSSALLTLGEWAESLRKNIPPQMQAQLDTFLQDLGTTIGEAVKNMFFTGISLIPTTIGLVLGIASLPVFLFYLLKDWEKMGRGFYSAFPGWANEHAKNIMSIIERVLGRYIRANILLALIIGVMDYIGLLVLQAEFAIVLAVFAAVMEMVPTLGPWLAGATAVVVTLALTPEKAIWVAALFLGVEILENTLICPKIQSAYLNIHPALVILLLVMGGYLGGFWGLLLIVPVTATVAEIYKYVRHVISIGDEHPQQDLVIETKHLPDKQ